MSIDPVFDAMRHASSGMESQSLRLRLSAENLSNGDTPGYRRKLISFRETAEGITPSRVRLSQDDLQRIHDPAHPLADEDGMVNMSNVDMMLELADARSAGRGYEANLQVFSQARQIYDSLLSIIRR